MISKNTIDAWRKIGWSDAEIKEFCITNDYELPNLKQSNLLSKNKPRTLSRQTRTVRLLIEVENYLNNHKLNFNKLVNKLLSEYFFKTKSEEILK